MKTTSKSKKAGKIFWGVFLLLAAVFLVVSQLGYLQGVGVVSILFAIFWVAILIEGIARGSFGKILFSIAFLCIVFDEPLGITAITPWTVLAAALLGTIGLNMIFKRRKHYHYEYHYQNDWKEQYANNVIDVDATEEDQESGSSGKDVQNGGRIYFHTNFGSSVKYVNSDNFEFANLECSFGAMKGYFDNAIVQNGNAIIHLDVSFGGVELYLPKHWAVVNNTDNAFGGIDEKNHNQPSGNTVVTLTGDVNFAGVTILYV